MKKLRKRKVKRRSSKAASLRKVVAAARIRRKGFVEKAGRQGASEAASSPAGSLFLALVLIAGLVMGGALSLFFPLDATDAGRPAEISIAAGGPGITVIEGGDLPSSQIHWHASLKIIAAGVEVPIPAGIGIELGNNVDNEASGAQSAPIHTHEADGVLHVEVLEPRKNPEQTTLGSFFNRVWGKKFSRECVLEYCNGPAGKVKMFVNGRQSEEFGDYSLKDGDEILISFELENQS